MRGHLGIELKAKVIATLASCGGEICRASVRVRHPAQHLIALLHHGRLQMILVLLRVGILREACDGC